MFLEVWVSPPPTNLLVTDLNYIPFGSGEQETQETQACRAHIICILKVFYSLTNRICNYRRCLEAKIFHSQPDRLMGTLTLCYCTYCHFFYKMINPTCSYAISTIQISEDEAWEQISESFPPSPFPPSPGGTAHRTDSHRGCWAVLAHALMTPCHSRLIRFATTDRKQCRVCHVMLQKVSHHFPVLWAR